MDSRVLDATNYVKHQNANNNSETFETINGNPSTFHISIRRRKNTNTVLASLGFQKTMVK